MTKLRVYKNRLLFISELLFLNVQLAKVQNCVGSSVETSRLLCFGSEMGKNLLPRLARSQFIS